MVRQRERWRAGDPLEPAEKQVLAHVAIGETYEATGGSHSGASVRADVVRHLLVSSDWPIDPRGVRLRGVRVRGLLDLDAVAVRCPLVLDDCDLDPDGPLVVDRATFPLLALTRCRLAGLSGDALTVSGNLNLIGSQVSGQVILGGARIGAALLCQGTRVDSGENGYSLMCSGMSVRLTVHLSQGFSATGAVVIQRSDIGGELICQDARLGMHPGTRVSLDAHAARVGGAAILSGLIADGSVSLNGSAVGGQIICNGAKVGADADGISLACEGLRAGGSVHLDRSPSGNPFDAAGAVRLAGAEVTGSLTCRGARLGANDYCNSLIADELKVTVAMLLEDGFTAGGAIRIPGASAGGQLRLSSARLQGSDKSGFSLVADGVTVGGAAYFDEGFSAAATTTLTGAQIVGSLHCEGAHLRAGPSGIALAGDGLNVGGSIYLSGSFTYDGVIRLSQAVVGGSFRLGSSTLHHSGDGDALTAEQSTIGGGVFMNNGFAATGGLSLRGTRIGGELCWDPAAPVSGQVNLEGTTVRYLVDNWAASRPGGGWPTGRLRLLGFTYQALAGDHQATATQRLAWIRSQYLQSPPDRGSTAASIPDPAPANAPPAPQPQPEQTRPGPPFATQPYRHLADVYRSAGQDDDARGIEIALRRDLRRYGNLTTTGKATNWLLDVTIRYGYQTGRALIGIACLYMLAFAAALAAQHQGNLIVATSFYNPALHPTALRCATGYPCFYPAGYAFDLVVPLINIHQADYWQVNGNHPLGWIWVTGSWTITACGWFLATLLVVGYSGLARQQ